MKYLFSIIFIVAFSCCQEESIYLKKYPYFENVSVHNEEGTVILNNFKSNEVKEGLEYLVDDAGFLIEIRQWKNNYLNGYTARYCKSGKIVMLGHMLNDTLCGDYYSFDTINSSVKEYREYLNIGGYSTVNQIISLSNGIIDYNASSFYRVNKAESGTYKINLFSKFGNPFIIAKWCSSDTLDYNFYVDKYNYSATSSNGKYIDLTIQDPKQFVKGYFINYRLPTNEEIKHGATKEDKIGPIMYFRFKTQ